MKIEDRISDITKNFTEQKIVHHPSLAITKLYHVCGLNHQGGFNVLINKKYPCHTPTNHIFWFHPNAKKFKIKNKKVCHKRVLQ